MPENPIVYKFFRCVLFICQEKSCTIPTCVSKTNGSFHNAAQCICIFTWVFQRCFGRKDSATFAHVLFFLVCKLWPLKLAPSEPVGLGLVVGILLSLQLDRVLLGYFKKIVCFQGAWASLNIWVNNWLCAVPCGSHLTGKTWSLLTLSWPLCNLYRLTSGNLQQTHKLTTRLGSLVWTGDKSSAVHVAFYASLIIFPNNVVVGGITFIQKFQIIYNLYGTFLEEVEISFQWLHAFLI